MDETQEKKAKKRRRQKAKHKEKSVISSDQSEMDKGSEKTKEQILAERQAKKASKKQIKTTTAPAPAKAANPSQSPVKSTSSTAVEKISTKVEVPVAKPLPQIQEKPQVSQEKTREQVIAEREAKKMAKLAAKNKTGSEKTESPKQQPIPQQSSDKKQSEQKRQVVKMNSDIDLAEKMEHLHINEAMAIPQEKKILSKAERRAIQEAQRAAKVKAQLKPTKAPLKIESKIKESKPTPTQVPHHQKQPSSAVHKVKLFKHLYTEKCDLNINVNGQYHPAIIKLGIQYANDVIVGSNARCYAFLNALKTLINDFVTPEEKLFTRALEAEIQKSVDFLQKCRPLAVSMTNALKHTKLLISQEKETSADNDEKKKLRIMSKIDTYAQEEIETAAIAISLKVREKISDDDVILTFGCSSLIKRSLVEAWKDGEKKFSVVVIDSRPDYEGQVMLNSLAMEGISCTYVLINAISFIMPKVTKVLLGAHALLANGYVMSRVGTAQISMVANYFNVPVLICCETHKFSERVQTDSFVYNELGDPNALAWNKNSKSKYEHLKDWESIPHLTPLNLRYDITPPELITAVVTEVALLPCTSVQVILRVKPSE